ncbi:MAG: hypothetical protein KF819_15385 [Labilithrix sp.]|nr:hypothetical protein [Labilithrix sp.]
MQQHPVYAYGPPPTMRQEYPILSEQGVTVTTARFVVYQQTYPIAGITSVAPFQQPASRGGPILLACLFGLMMFVGFAGGAIGGGLFFLVLMGICIAVAASRKDTFGVVVWTAGTNVRALVTHDGAFVGRVVVALNQAIASR